MNEQNDPEVTFDVRRYWQVVGGWSAVQWWEMQPGTDAAFTVGPEGMVLYQYVDFELLRSIPLARMQPHIDGYPEIEQDDAPTQDQIRQAWLEPVNARIRAKRKAVLDTFDHRREGETADAFYVRVADFYRAAVVSTGQPLRALMDAADIPKTQAAGWVREARRRKHLDPTTRRRGK